MQTGWGTSVDVFCVELPEEPVNDGEPCRVDELGVDDCAAHSSCWVYPDGADVGECVPNCGAEFTCPEGRRCVHLLGQCLAYCDPLEASACPGSERCVEVMGTGLFLCVDATGDVPPGEACTLSSDCHVGGACKSVGVGAVCAEGVDRCCVPLCDLEDPVACQELPTTTCDAWPIPGGLPEPLAHVGVCREP
ncbi:MAG: hypothetical protein KC468_32810 [Myxococcales bacterium]|nr:hypothetical protein [Myxococcales bacterium]